MSVAETAMPPEQQQALKDKGADLTPEASARMAAFVTSDRSGALTGKILSARWDDPDKLARDIEALNASSRNTMRKIDDSNYSARTPNSD